MHSKTINKIITLPARINMIQSLAFVFGLGFSLGLAAQPVEIDKVIAIVDEDVILQSEFNERMVQVQANIAELGAANAPPEDVLKEQILEQLIIEHLQMQMANRAGIRIDDNQLNGAMNVIAQQNNMDFDSFRAVLEEQGLYLATREQLRKEMIINQFQNGAVNQRIDITRQEVENYLRSETGVADIAPEYRVAHILIPNSPNTSENIRAELADLLYEQLQQGANILQIAAAQQISGIPVSGGDLDWNKVENLPSLFGRVVPEMERGEITPPFTSSNGYHILQLLDIRGGADLKLDQAYVRHIMITPNEIRTEAQAEALIHELYERIQNGEDFADIARQNTDDPTSMVAGGDLEWINEGMLPQDFMDIINATPVGEMTEPFRASTGWHIAEVMDRRVQDVTEDNKRFQAQQLLRNRKFENELQNWLTEIRDTAYVDIK